MDKPVNLFDEMAEEIRRFMESGARCAYLKKIGMADAPMMAWQYRTAAERAGIKGVNIIDFYGDIWAGRAD